MTEKEKENRINSFALSFLGQQQIVPNLYADQIIRGYKEGYHQAEKDLKAKQVDIASMADEYYDALMKEAADWMDEGTMGHCRLAYYNGCKDVLNKIQKGE